jgi:hypothetical protein
MLQVPPPTCLGLEPSFGYGDRLGLATPGHLQAQREFAGPIQPIFAQQSIREMARTNRTPQRVMGDAVAGLKVAEYLAAWGADADHLKTPADVDATAAAGFVFFTIDPSDHVDGEADDCSSSALREKYTAVRGDCLWVEKYRGRTITVADGPAIEFDELTLQRAAVKYGRAIAHAIALAKHIEHVMAARGKPYEIELSVDETPHPTTPAEHYIIAEQCLAAGMRLVSLAPRFVGEFEKGIDFKGDLDDLEKSLKQHAAIARQLGPYKLSLHSGSDKLSMYAMFARATRGLFHVKTAGTSYLEALRVVARHDATLFRQIVDHARERFSTDRATYHISASLDRVPPPCDISDVRQLEQRYLNENDGRQILHVTFGSILKHTALGPAMKAVLIAEPATHAQVLTEHFGRHLQELRAGM